jgi:DMSO/TMAO reductase YedYZ molybdopterin-dependent catalytic subunit
MSIRFVNNREISMLDNQSVDEEEYLATREEQFVRRLTRSGYSRREVLKLGVAGASVAAGIGHFARPGLARAATVPSAPIVKPLPPEWFINYGTNAEMRWDSVAGLGYLTPNERFFVRDHTATPLIDAKSWSLSLWGDGLRGAPTQDNPITLNYRQLRSLPSVEVPAFIECAGNGRSFFASQEGTPAAGTQWGLGAIGVAKWRGVRLAEILERARVLPGTVDVMPQGLDADYVTGGVDYGHVRRPLPIAKAFKDAILAYEMNDEPLPPDNGFPVRLIVPGWVGIANIKWLGEIQVAKEPLFSYWNTTTYVLSGPDYPTSPPLTHQKVKSAFELAFNATLPNQRQVLTGRSWSGRAPIRRVDISTDGGSSWRPARLRSPNPRDAWVRWEFPWRPPGPGSYTLQARATDWTGQTQPATVPFNTGGYLFWAIVDHPVVVSA